MADSTGVNAYGLLRRVEEQVGALGGELPVILEHRGTGYIGELAAVQVTDVDEVPCLVLLGEEPTAALMPTLDNGRPRFHPMPVSDTYPGPEGWVCVVDNAVRGEDVVAIVEPEHFQRTWMAVVAEERRHPQ
jgi:hypothetical protein